MHQQGQLDQAAALYEQILQSQPRNFDALQLLATIALQRKNSAAAVELFDRALRIKPDHADALNNRGFALRDLKRSEEALDSYDRALGIRPDFAEALYNRGAALQDLKRSNEALESYDRALKIRPDFAEALNNRGDALADLERCEEALASYDRALEIRPDYADALNARGNVLQDLERPEEALESHDRALSVEPGNADALNNRGVALHGLKRLEEALKSYDRALEVEPDRADALYNRGLLLLDLKRSEEALDSFDRALEIEPDHADALCNRGLALRGLERLSEAEASFRRAVALKPNVHETHSNLGVVLFDLGRSRESQMSHRRAVEINPDFHEGHLNLGNALRAMGRLRESEASFLRALECKPDYADAHCNLGGILQNAGLLAEADERFRRALELKPDFAVAHDNLIFILDLREGIGAKEQQEERRRWYAQHGLVHAASIRPHDNLPDVERRLRIGYVSADFRRHSAYYTFSPVILRHEPSAFEVFCYSEGRREDDATARLRQGVQHWRPTTGVSDEALAEQIRADQIDILVDLSGHSAGNRLLVFARKPAPVQVTAWGHATGTGLETMDYYFADPVLVPAAERELYAEEVFDLPCFLCYEPPEYLPEVSPLPAHEGTPFTFGCINRVEKISDHSLVLWGRILAQMPGSVLLLKDKALDDAGHRQHFTRRLGEAGIGAGRVRLLGWTAHAEHLKIFAEVDLGLDPFPQGGGISTAEALSMGLPVVTLKGPTVASRASAAILASLGMHEWIADSDQEYVRIALQAAQDLPRLARTRADLRQRLAASAFGDPERYTRAVEEAYRSMWRRWCEGHVSGPAMPSGKAGR